MAKIIAVSIDVTKIDKSKIVSLDKNGQPFKNGAKYINLSVIVNDEADQFGNDCAITMGQTKEEREAKADKVYLGNGKTVWNSAPTQAPSQPTQTHEAKPIGAEDEDPDLPF